MFKRSAVTCRTIASLTLLVLFASLQVLAEETPMPGAADLAPMITCEGLTAIPTCHYHPPSGFCPPYYQPPSLPVSLPPMLYGCWTSCCGVLGGPADPPGPINTTIITRKRSEERVEDKPGDVRIENRTEESISRRRTSPVVRYPPPDIEVVDLPMDEQLVQPLPKELIFPHPGGPLPGERDQPITPLPEPPVETERPPETTEPSTETRTEQMEEPSRRDSQPSGNDDVERISLNLDEEHLPPDYDGSFGLPSVPWTRGQERLGIFEIGLGTEPDIVATALIDNMHDDGMGSSYLVLVLAKQGSLLVCFLEGDERGTSFLIQTIADDLPRVWLYIPCIGLQKELVSPEELAGSFAGSALSYVDAASNADSFAEVGEWIGEGSFAVDDTPSAVDVVRLAVDSPLGTDYSEALFWVDRACGIATAARYLDDSGDVVATMEAYFLGEFEGHAVADEIRVENMADGSITWIQFLDRRRLESPLPDSVFDPEALPSLDCEALEFLDPFDLDTFDPEMLGRTATEEPEQPDESSQHDSPTSGDDERPEVTLPVFESPDLPVELYPPLSGGRASGYEIMPADARIVSLNVGGTMYESADLGVQGGTLHVVRIEGPLRWNALTAHDAATTWFTNRMHRGLVSRDPLSGAIVPDFAKSYEVSEDSLVIIFHLREDVRWSNGEPITADDVVFTFNDIILNEDVDCDWRGRLLLPDDTYPVCEKIDDYTVIFTMSTIFRPAFSFLSFPILPEHMLAQFVHLRNPDVPVGTFNETWTLDTPLDELVCNGPWIVTEYIPDVLVTMESNPYYYGYDPAGVQLPYYDNVVAEIVTNQDVALLKFRNGEIDTFAPRGSDIPILLPEGEERGFTVLITDDPTREKTYIMLNQDIGLAEGANAEKRELYRDVRFRQAVTHLVDSETIISNIHNGLATVPWSAVPMTSPFYAGRDVYGGPITESNARFFSYDQAGAAELLDELGVIDWDGDGWRNLPSGAPLTMLIETQDDTNLIGSCLVLCDDLQAVGLNADLRVMGTAALIDRFFASTSDIWIHNALGSDEPNDDSSLFHSCGSLHGFRYSACDDPTEIDLRIDELLALGAATFDLDEALDYYVEMQHLLSEQLGFIPMCQPTFQYAYYNHVGNASLASPISSPDGPDGLLMEMCFDRRLVD